MSEDHLIPIHVEHISAICNLQDRLSAVAFLLKQEWTKYQNSSTSNNNTPFQCIVFADDESSVNSYKDKLFDVLRKGGVVSQEDDIACLTAFKSIDSRRESLKHFRDGVSKILLCSDIASRGLDLPNNALVIQVSCNEVVMLKSFVKSGCFVFLFFLFLLWCHR